MKKNGMKLLTNILEYIFLLVILLECNSMYVYGVQGYSIDMFGIFYKTGIVLLCVILSLYVIMDRSLLKRLKSYYGVVALVFLCAGVFFVFNVFPMHHAARSSNYIQNFFFYIPAMMLLWKLHRLHEEPYELWYKYTKLVIAFCIINQLLYWTDVLNSSLIPTVMIQTRWSGLNRLEERIGFLNFCVECIRMKWQIIGIPLMRNYGLHTEPLMFCIPLITALSTELFLNRNTLRRMVFNSIILSLTIITAQSTLGLMLLACCWGVKGIEWCIKNRKYKWIFLITGVAAVFIAFFIFSKHQQSFSGIEGSGTSISDHIQDFKIGIKAFLHKPLFGGGYKNWNYLYTFMTERRLASNRGFSNTSAILLGEGGAWLGAFCMLPFLLCLLQFPKKKDRRLALWIVGPIGLYVGVIFHYHLYLMMLISFGYSLLEMKKRGIKGLPCLVFTEDALKRETNTYGGQKPDKKRCLALVLLFVLCIGLFCSFKEVIFDYGYYFMMTHQLSLSQSPLKAFCFNLCLLMHILLIGRTLKKKLNGRWVISLLFYDSVFFVVYGRIYGIINTFLSVTEKWSEIRESFVLLGIYWAGAGCILTIDYLMQNHKRKWVFWSFLLLLVIFCTGIYQTGNRWFDRYQERVQPYYDLTEMVVEHASGPVYVENLQLLFNRMNKDIGYSAAKKEGFSVYRNSSVLMKKVKQSDLQEMFDAGFRVAELSRDYVLYSNDEQLIDALQEEGVVFYRYYPFEDVVNIRVEAEWNEQPFSEEGMLLTGGEEGSLIHGPYDVLRKGRYTVTYDLKIEDSALLHENQETVIGRLMVSSFSGETGLSVKELVPSMFDNDGMARIDVPFTLSVDSEGIEYLVYVAEGYTVTVKKIAVKHTPDYITIATYNSHGLSTREEYYGLDELPYVTAQGYSSIEKEYNSADQLKSVKYYNKNGVMDKISYGYAMIKYDYNIKGGVSRESYFGSDLKPLNLKTGYAAVETGYDPYGNVSELRYYDENGKLVQLAGGYAQVKKYYDGNGQMIREEYYDIDGARCIYNRGYSALEKAFDEKGNIVEQRYLGTDDKLTLNIWGYSVVHYTYNEANQIIRTEFSDVNGNRCFNNEGYAIVEKKYDDAGNVAEEYYYDIYGNLASVNGGYAIIRRSFNEKRQNVQEMYFDKTGVPVTCTGGYYGIERKYDDIGNNTERIMVDQYGLPMLNTSRIAIIRYSYDKNRNVSKEEYYGLNGEKIAGSAEIQRFYNENNQNVMDKYYDKTGNILVKSDGTSGLMRTFMENGNVASNVYLDENSLPIENSSGVTSVNYEFNAFNLISVEKYQNSSGDAVSNTSGVAAISKQYNEHFRLTEDHYLDKEGNPVMSSGGFGGLRREYDEAGNIICFTCLDTENKPVITTSGYAILRREYDDVRNCVAEYYFDCDGQPIQVSGGYYGILREYDEKRLLRRQVFVDRDGKAVLSTSGYASFVKEYDEAEHVIREEYYNPDGSPAVLSDGYAVIEREYDADGQLLEERRLGAKGEKVP